MELKIASPMAVRFACMNYHYAKSVPAAQVAYSVFEQKEFCGVVVYGHGSNPHMPFVYSKWFGQLLELVRVALNGKQEMTSAVVGRSLKLLKKDAPLVDMVVSYADIDQGHDGIIYQATNWIYVGIVEENQSSHAVINGKKMHPRSIGAKYGTRAIEWLKLNIDPSAKYLKTKGKHKYLMPMNKKMRKLIHPLSQPYPKADKAGDDRDHRNSGGAAPTYPLQKE